MNALLKDLDLHVPGIAVWPLILAAMLPFMWMVYLVALVPQGRIISVAGDRRKSGKPSFGYVIVNEAIVVIAVGMAVLLRGQFYW